MSAIVSSDVLPHLTHKNTPDSMLRHPEVTRDTPASPSQTLKSSDTSHLRLSELRADVFFSACYSLTKSHLKAMAHVFLARRPFEIINPRVHFVAVNMIDLSLSGLGRWQKEICDKAMYLGATNAFVVSPKFDHWVAVRVGKSLLVSGASYTTKVRNLIFRVIGNFDPFFFHSGEYTSPDTIKEVP